MTSLEKAKAAAKALDSKRAEDIRALKVDDLTVITDYFVIATGTSVTQVRALAQEVEFQLLQQGESPLRVQGYDTCNWVVLDYGTVIVHVFYPAQREYYNLEHLWADAKPVELELEA